MGERFFAPVQTDPGPHQAPASCTMSTGSLSGGKALVAQRWPPTPCRAEVEERLELYIYSLSGPLWPFTGELQIYFSFRTLRVIHQEDEKSRSHNTYVGFMICTLCCAHSFSADCGEAILLFNLRTGRLYPRRNPWYSFSEAESTSGHMFLSEGTKEKIPSDTTGNRSRDRPTIQWRIDKSKTPFLGARWGHCRRYIIFAVYDARKLKGVGRVRLTISLLPGMILL
jgi:hypothetical protein